MLDAVCHIHGRSVPPQATAQSPYTHQVGTTLLPPILPPSLGSQRLFVTASQGGPDQETGDAADGLNRSFHPAYLVRLDWLDWLRCRDPFDDVRRTFCKRRQQTNHAGHSHTFLRLHRHPASNAPFASLVLQTRSTRELRVCIRLSLTGFAPSNSSHGLLWKAI